MDVSSFSRRWCSWCYGDFTRVFWRGTWGTQEVQVGWNFHASWTLRRQLVLKIEDYWDWKILFFVSTYSLETFPSGFCLRLFSAWMFRWSIVSSYLSLQFKCLIFHIFTWIFVINVYITNSQSGQLPGGLIAQLVEHYTSVAEVMVRIPFRPEFFSGFDFHNCLS